MVGGITDVGNTIGDGFNSAGHAIEHAGHSVIHSIGSKLPLPVTFLTEF